MRPITRRITHAVLLTPILALAALLLAPAAATAATVTVTQLAYAFDQTEITLKAGDHINFQNAGDANHNILIQTGDDDDDGKDLGVQAPGAAIDVPFDKAGKFKVRCHIHPGMKIAVTVQ